MMGNEELLKELAKAVAEGDQSLEYEIEQILDARA